MPVLPDPAPALQFSLRTGYSTGFGSGFGSVFGVQPAAQVTPSLGATERAATLERDLARALESWLSDELPLILAREFDALVDRVRAEALAQMRQDLLPELAERIARQLHGRD